MGTTFFNSAMKITSFAKPCLLIAFILAFPRPIFGQAGFDDDCVMLQGFYWESYRHGDANFKKFGDKKWYDIVRENAGAIRDGGFDLLFLSSKYSIAPPEDGLRHSTSFAIFGAERRRLLDLRQAPQ